MVKGTLEKKPLSDKELNALWRKSASVEWASPSNIVDAARIAMGGIDLDPASSGVANEMVQATRYFSLEKPDEAFASKWFGRIWLNPPYGKPSSGVSNAGIWADRLWREFSEGNAQEACLYVKAAIGYKWWDRALSRADSACILWDLPSHENLVDGRKGYSPMGRSVMYYGDHTSEFKEAFSALGWFAHRHDRRGSIS